MMNTTNKTINQIATEWIDTVGVRMYAPEHGCANGHRYYISTSFIAGYKTALKQVRDIINADIKDQNGISEIH